jgi:hypothetical protein
MAQNVDFILKNSYKFGFYLIHSCFDGRIFFRSTRMVTNSHVSGQLYKFTNALRGFQHRYFILDPARGTLEYYLPHDTQRLHPRGFIILSGAIVTPSEDDGQTFSVCSSSGEIYKLRASDSRERQLWVDRLRQVSQSNSLPSHDSSSLEISASGSLDAVKKILERSSCDLKNLEASIDNHTVGDHDLLRMKALAQASVTAMKECYSLLSSH